MSYDGRFVMLCSIMERTEINPRIAKAGYREMVTNLIWLGLTVVAVYAFARFLGIDATRERIASAGLWGPFLVIALKASTLVLAPLGGSPLYPIAGALFGFLKGSLYTFIGDLLGASIAFYISRLFGRRIAAYFLTRPGMRAVDAILGYLGTTRGLIQARLIFFAFPEGVTYAAGLTRIPFWKFLAVVVPIGLVPHLLLVAFGEVVAAYIATYPALVFAGFAGATLITAGGGYWFYRKARARSLKNRGDSPTIAA